VAEFHEVGWAVYKAEPSCDFHQPVLPTPTAVLVIRLIEILEKKMQVAIEVAGKLVSVWISIFTEFQESNPPNLQFVALRSSAVEISTLSVFCCKGDGSKVLLSNHRTIATEGFDVLNRICTILQNTVFQNSTFHLIFTVE